MAGQSIFVSVGGTSTPAQEEFVRAVEDRLRSEGLVPHTVGRNTFSSDAPLKAVMELMDKCVGTVVIALERSYFEEGLEERGGPQEGILRNVVLPTPWCQIEAAISYSRHLPLLVIVENDLKDEGLLEHGYDWYVQRVKPDPSYLNSLEFNGVLASWKSKLAEASSARSESRKGVLGSNTAEITIGELIKGLKPTQLWSALVALASLVGAAFAMGAKLTGGP